ncbi:MAG: hypothetical protein ACFFC5_06155 [Promethearchaeota archaeon]
MDREPPCSLEGVHIEVLWMKILSGGIVKFVMLLIVGFIALNAILLLASNATLTLFLFVIPMVLTLIALNFNHLKRLAKGTKKKLDSFARTRYEKREKPDRLRELDILRDLQFYFYGNFEDVVIVKRGSQIAAVGFLALQKVPKGLTGDLNGILKTLHDENISLTYVLVQNPANDQTNSEKKDILYLQENYWNVQALIAIHKNMKGFLNLEEKCRTLTEEVRQNMFIVKTSFHTSFPECKIHKIVENNLVKVLQLAITGGGIDSGTGLDFFLQDYELASLIVSGQTSSSDTINWPSKKTNLPSDLSRDPIVQKAIQREFADRMIARGSDLTTPDSTPLLRTQSNSLNEDFSDDELPAAAEILRFLFDYPKSTHKHIASAADIHKASKVLNKLEGLNYVVSFLNSEDCEETKRFYLLTKKGEEALNAYNEHHGIASKELLILWSNLIDE